MAEQFSNVPNWLIEKVRSICDVVDRSDRASIYNHACGWVIAYYLGKNVADPEADAFFDHRVLEDDALYHGHVNRVNMLGESLFLLRSQPGFAEFCRRMADRNLRVSYFEMMAAKQFFKAGFEIHAQPEKQRRGSDFDFKAIRERLVVNGEVTAFTTDAFSASTVLNGLKKKRKQLPADNPAVVYCVLPEDWDDGSVDFEVELNALTGEFFRGTQRVSAVIFWMEQHFPAPDGISGGLGLVRKTYANPRARFPFCEPFLNGGANNAEMIDAIANGDNLAPFLKQINQSEFHQWVDSVLSL